MEHSEILRQLAQAVVDLEALEAMARVEEGLATGLAPARLLAEGLSAGMRVVGEKFKCGEVFMPEVLVCCDVFYQGLERLKPLLGSEGGRGQRGKMILGTIHGDIHTVGKDVAAPVFEAAGFEVVDLGVDVADANLVQAIRAHRPHLVGLGTYMTSTFMHTRETVRVIEEAGLRAQVKIICGGPAVDPGAARRMGADDASDDAWEAVAKLDRLMGQLKAEGRAS